MERHDDFNVRRPSRTLEIITSLQASINGQSQRVFFFFNRLYQSRFITVGVSNCIEQGMNSNLLYKNEIARTMTKKRQHE